ncbi:MAG TPA: hypothetical protein VFR42_08095 [Candidatus Acidoferrum sp.]|nr:hypothetical protein [Candidatus Acidoferrum sp.]
MGKLAAMMSEDEEIRFPDAVQIEPNLAARQELDSFNSVILEPMKESGTPADLFGGAAK